MASLAEQLYAAWSLAPRPFASSRVTHAFSDLQPTERSAWDRVAEVVTNTISIASKEATIAALRKSIADIKAVASETERRMTKWLEALRAAGVSDEQMQSALNACKEPT